MQKLSGEIVQQKFSTDMQSAQINVVFDVRAIKTGNKKVYQIDFTEENFSQELKRYTMVIPHTVHNLGERYLVSKIARIENGVEGNIFHQYRILINGDFVLWSDEPFCGRIIISEI